jgi:hypothetical protein
MPPPTPPVGSGYNNSMTVINIGGPIGRKSEEMEHITHQLDSVN